MAETKQWTQVFLLLLALSCGFVRADLVFLQAVFRNGLSAPEELYPTDLNSWSAWEEGPGQLTLVGKRQAYGVGKQLRERYKNFLSSNPHEVYTLSSSLPKCINSALSLLASLLSPTDSWTFLKGFNWQPTPVFYWPENEDTLLGPLHKCPAVLREIQKSVDPRANDTTLEMYKQQFRFWTMNSGTAVRHWDHASALYRILFAEYTARMKVPSWAWKYWKELRCLNDYTYKINFSNPSILRVFGGPMLWNMIENTLEHIYGRSKKLKMLLFSGQSIHVAGVLGALLGSTDSEPPFASTLLMELHKPPDTTSDYSVRWIFLNGTAEQVLRVPGCTEYCPLQYVMDQAERWNNTRWEQECLGDTRQLQLQQLMHVVRLGEQRMSKETLW